ncbi:MAG: hypothetical protein BGO55_03115 [Sphingobacteriales bacterium 50-39]|uniref:V-type ATPase 116kDa subunit family protein n=1 Tax=Puia sp. TaxID=2045100 RepID=UPI000926E8E0|nr:V-type ATPase 116kDa subunit family protein [Puia sp.]MBN8852726.1 hypothetical protein [Sphingobacteriales bacterium]OJW55547.1 MAG: hypothetical protein BGO55_03115 [Sphingobacteriales bacterium 50-39]
MIVPMTKFSLLIFHREYESFLQDLGQIGTFHVAERKNGNDTEQIQLRQMITEIEEAITFLMSHRPEDQAVSSKEEKPVSEMLTEIKQAKERSEEDPDKNTSDIVEQLASSYLSSLQKEHLTLTAKEELYRIMINTEVACEGKVRVLEGFVPRAQRKVFAGFLDSKKIAYLQKRARFSDDPPILIRNNWFNRLFEPIAELFSLPSYKDLDLTIFFAPFFALFFGFGMNDSGYGILLFAGATIVKIVGKPRVKRSYLTLVQLLGVITFFFGFITGNFFGVSLADIPGLSFLKGYFLKDQQIFTLAIAIGFVQILFGMMLQGINKMVKFGFRYGLPQVGWIMIILHLVNMFYFKVWPLYSHIDIYIGLGLIIFFADPDAGFFKGIGTGIWELFGITGLMGDLLSYIRLFALGVSSAILALVINNIAGQIEKTAFIGPILFLIILVFGHSLNLFVASLGAFVHTMRLTFVEFYKNAGFTGGGNPYKPFSTISN